MLVESRRACSAPWSAPPRAGRSSSRRPASAKGPARDWRRVTGSAVRHGAVLHAAGAAAAAPGFRLRPGPDGRRRDDVRLGQAKIDFDDLTEVVPAFVTIVMMVFTYNIANGLTAGLILYPLLKMATGRLGKSRRGPSCSALCLVYYVFGLPH